MAVIEVDHLTKDYQHGRGIFSVSFQINKGEVFGFLGPNGAGKTTTIRHLMGFSNPQEGVATINGMLCNQQSSEILQNVGYLPGEIALPEGLTGWEFIRMMQGLRNCYDKERLDYLLELFQLDPAGKTKRMSLGNKRKLAVVTAFMADPQILILDEPTSGLDPLMQERFIAFMKEEKERGKTILLSSHMFSEVDAICDRVSIIKEGKIVSTIRMDDIRHNTNKTYEVTFESEKDIVGFQEKSPFELTYSNVKQRMVELSIDDSDINLFIQILNQFKPCSLKEKKFTLENYFMHFYQKEETKMTGGVVQ